MNRTCAPGKSLAEFISLAQMVGLRAVEIRNDIEPREFADGTPAADLRARLDEAGLKVASVNALQRFNDWNDDRAAEARRLVAYAAALGAPGLVFCPVHTPESWTQAEAEAKLREGGRALEDEGISDTTLFFGHELNKNSRSLLEGGIMDVTIGHDFDREVAFAVDCIRMARQGVQPVNRITQSQVFTRFNCAIF